MNTTFIFIDINISYNVIYTIYNCGEIILTYYLVTINKEHLQSIFIISGLISSNRQTLNTCLTSMVNIVS